MGLRVNHCQTEILNASVLQDFMGRHVLKSSMPATAIPASMMPNVKYSKLDAFCKYHLTVVSLVECS